MKTIWSGCISPDRKHFVTQIDLIYFLFLLSFFFSNKCILFSLWYILCHLHYLVMQCNFLLLLTFLVKLIVIYVWKVQHSLIFLPYIINCITLKPNLYKTYFIPSPFCSSNYNSEIDFLCICMAWESVWTLIFFTLFCCATVVEHNHLLCLDPYFTEAELKWISWIKLGFFFICIYCYYNH